MKNLRVITLTCHLAVLFLSAPSLHAASVPPEDLSDLQTEAVGLYQAGRYDAAIPLYRRLAEAQPDNKGAFKDLLIALWLGEHYQEAADVGERLTGLSKNDLDAEFIYARALLATGQKESALAAFKRCRELDPDEQHIQLAAARVEGMLRDYDSALAHMESLKKSHPEYKEIYPELARVQQITGTYAAAAESWDKAADFYPDNRAYRFHEAECLFYAGQRDESVRALQALTAQQPYWPAIDFLTDIALAKGDLKTARSLLEKNLQTLRIDDSYRLLKLIRINQREERWEEVISVADRWLTINTRSGTARMLKADALKHLGRYPEAGRLYQEILQMNPETIDAWIGMGEMEKAKALDPTNPYLLINHPSRDVLVNWIASHPGPTLPVVAYHGLTTDPGDPMLASSLHRTVANFEDHMRALHEARFTPVTSAQINTWLLGKSSLLERPVFITFDDARLDSFRNADPILQKYDLKATMFVPLINVEGSVPRYATWKDLARYQATGRWDIESHGDRAHEYIPVDAEGHNGLFLLNKKWLEKARRLESDSEWSRRAQSDYQKSQRKIDAQLGQTPRAFSFPEGNYGQEGISNSPETAAQNLKWAREVFDTAYHQDEYGINVRTRDPMHLTRFEPPPTLTGAALVRHLTDQTPAILMVRRLLHEAAWENRVPEAQRWLAELKQRGASSSCLWAEDARVHVAMGDFEGARALSEKAVQEDDSLENRELLDQINRLRNLGWTGRFSYQEDNQHRISRRFRQDIGFWRAAGVDLSLHHLAGSYSEGGVETVTEQGGGIGLARNFNTSNRLSAEASGHFLSGPAKNAYTVSGRLTSKWAGDLRTDLEGGRDLYYFARAIQANVISHYVDGLLRWTPPTDWRASVHGRAEDLSDDNERASGMIESGRRALLPRLWFVARASIDTTKHVSSNYYSPQVLQEYQAGLDYTVLLGKGSNLNVVYLPGYGKEKVSDGVLVHDIDVVLNLVLGRSLTLTPSAAFIRQPTYHRDTYSATLSYRF